MEANGAGRSNFITTDNRVIQIVNLMCNTFDFILKPSHPGRAEDDGTSNSRKRRQYEPGSCGSNGVESAKDHAREFGLLESVPSNESQPFQRTSGCVCKI